LANPRRPARGYTAADRLPIRGRRGQLINPARDGEGATKTPAYAPARRPLVCPANQAVHPRPIRLQKTLDTHAKEKYDSDFLKMIFNFTASTATMKSSR
jgi:hypothetical protein